MKSAASRKVIKPLAVGQFDRLGKWTIPRHGPDHIVSAKKGPGSLRGPQPCRGTSAQTASGSNYCHTCPFCKMSGSLWRIDNNTLANDTVHLLPVDAGPNHFEFELVISGQSLAGLRCQ